MYELRGHLGIKEPYSSAFLDFGTPPCHTEVIHNFVIFPIILAGSTASMGADSEMHDSVH
jgi:predicted transcriptional regulator